MLTISAFHKLSHWDFISCGSLKSGPCKIMRLERNDLKHAKHLENLTELGGFGWLLLLTYFSLTYILTTSRFLLLLAQDMALNIFLTNVRPTWPTCCKSMAFLQVAIKTTSNRCCCHYWFTKHVKTRACTRTEIKISEHSHIPSCISKERLKWWL